MWSSFDCGPVLQRGVSGMQRLNGELSDKPAVEGHLLSACRGLRHLAARRFVDGAIAKHDTLVIADGRRLVAALLRTCTSAAVVRGINTVHAASYTPRHHDVLGHFSLRQTG